MTSKRSHTKSRRGCGQCKSRRIKCDERPPRCGSCSKKGIECDYKEWNASFENLHVFAAANSRRIAAPQPSPSTTEPLSISTVTLTPSECFGIDDLGLFYHFILHTSQTLDPIADIQNHHIWQYEVPYLAQSHAFLMHAILGFAAAHQATTEAENSQPNTTKHAQSVLTARNHYSKALALFRSSIDNITTDRADALLCFCILISFLTLWLEFDKPTSEQDPIADFVSLLHILHHSISVLTQIQDTIRTTKIGGLLRHTWTQRPHALDPEVHDSLNQLEIMISTLAAPSSSSSPVTSTATSTTTPDSLSSADSSATSDPVPVLKDALFKLRRFYTLSDPRPTTWAYLNSWLVQLRPEFAVLLERRNPAALCLLAHWCVAACNAPKRWLFGEWPWRLMEAVVREIGVVDGSGDGSGSGSEGWGRGLEWPVRVTIGGSSSSLSEG